MKASWFPQEAEGHPRLPLFPVHNPSLEEHRCMPSCLPALHALWFLRPFHFFTLPINLLG